MVTVEDYERESIGHSDFAGRPIASMELLVIYIGCSRTRQAG